ncbi:hypothetical protein [Aurantivibrio plasticivorans]
MLRSAFLLFVLISPYVLAEGDDVQRSFVIIGIEESSRTTTIRSVHFREFTSGKKFKIINGNSFFAKQVPTGRYYLSEIWTHYSNVPKSELGKPEDISNTFVVTNDAVTYLGNWIFKDVDIRKKFTWDLDIEYNFDTVKEIIEKDTNIQKLPVRVAYGNGKVVQIVVKNPNER